MFFRLNMSEESPFKSCITLSTEQIRVNHSTTQTLLHASFMHGEHDAFKEHMKNNPVRQNFHGRLKQGIELVISRRRTMSDVAPTLITLLQNGAKLEHDHLIMSGEMTPYHVICRSTGDHQELLELMIKELGRTLVNAKDDNGCTALMYAVTNANIKCVKSLIANGADIHLIKDTPKVTDTMDSPLIDSISMTLSLSSSYNTKMDIFNLLLDSGADVNKPCHRQNRTAIMYAAAVGDVNFVEKLIQKGAQLNHKDREGHTVGTLAKSVDMLKCLIEEHGIDKNSTDNNGLSILYWAVHSGNIEAVRYLLRQRVTMTTFVPQECVEACCKCGKSIACHYPDATLLHTDPYVLAVRFNMLDVVRLMDEQGCQLGKSPEILTRAISTDSKDVVDYLLRNYKYPLNYEYTEKFNASRFNCHHETFLIKACRNQSVQMVKLLLEHGADPNIKYCVKEWPSIINVAISEQHVEIIACFIRRGVHLNIGSYYPKLTLSSDIDDIGVVLPFEAAVYDNHFYAAEMLLVAGCSRGIHSWNNNCAPKFKIVPEMQELLKEWDEHKNDVLPLKQRCRMVILNHLCPQADKKIKELPLPPQIIRYLSIPELDDILEAFKGKPLYDYYVN